MMSIISGVSATLTIVASVYGAALTGARANSCFNQNGSLMRLNAAGNQRWFYYETPKPRLRQAGVRRGTLRFDGQKSWNTYFGRLGGFRNTAPVNRWNMRLKGR